ncbi:MAG: GIY-YIG nuclease family protein [Selenomonadaceae bacterium]|nr:GIY-YIG nuclease family protein [Selenomonadaceae bacterium]MBR4382001.1 GIY-YIG nuclease family protein [Selenomonadaceae bacterium]
MKLESGGQTRWLKIINESGLYSLIFSSRKPGAKEFRKWVTSEVIPSIRKQWQLSNEDWLKQLAQKLLESVKSAEAQTKCVYVLEMSNGSVKIGVTGNFRRRARAAETGSGLTITDWCHSGYLPSSYAYFVEAECHKIFENCKIQGEFFNVSFAEAQAELNQLAEITESKTF